VIHHPGTMVSAGSGGQSGPMRVVVTGATGNVGTSVLRALTADPGVDEVIAPARRAPDRDLEGAQFISADVATDDLAAVFAGADAVVHLAWLIQPGRNEALTRRVNVSGSSIACRPISRGCGSCGWAVMTGGFSHAEPREAGAAMVYESVAELTRRLDDSPLR
jgi:uncharacterized protein YbjT (DUF2867 family)